MNIYPFIEAERAQQRSVRRAWELLEVSRAAYYATVPPSVGRPGRRRRAHRTDPPSPPGVKGRYGAPRIHADLRRRGHRHGSKRVARLLRAAGLGGRRPRRWKPTTIPDPAATDRADLIGRDFSVSAAAVNTRWCGDITSISTGEGWLYLATVIDSRRAGWSDSPGRAATHRAGRRCGDQRGRRP